MAGKKGWVAIKIKHDWSQIRTRERWVEDNVTARSRGKVAVTQGWHMPEVRNR